MCGRVRNVSLSGSTFCRRASCHAGCVLLVMTVQSTPAGDLPGRPWRMDCARTGTRSGRRGPHDWRSRPGGHAVRAGAHGFRYSPRSSAACGVSALSPEVLERVRGRHLSPSQSARHHRAGRVGHPARVCLGRIPEPHSRQMSVRTRAASRASESLRSGRCVRSAVTAASTFNLSRVARAASCSASFLLGPVAATPRLAAHHHLDLEQLAVIGAERAGQAVSGSGSSRDCSNSCSADL